MKSQIIIFRLIFLNFCLILLTGCLDEIDSVITDTVDGGLAIQGQIVKGNPSVVEVTIQTLFDFKKRARFEKVREVMLIDDSGNELPKRASHRGKQSPLKLEKNRWNERHLSKRRLRKRRRESTYPVFAGAWCTP